MANSGDTSVVNHPSLMDQHPHIAAALHHVQATQAIRTAAEVSGVMGFFHALHILTVVGGMVLGVVVAVTLALPFALIIQKSLVISRMRSGEKVKPDPKTHFFLSGLFLIFGLFGVAFAFFFPSSATGFALSMLAMALWSAVDGLRRWTERDKQVT